MSAQKPDGAPPPSPDPQDQLQRDASPADADGTPTAAATPISAATSSRVRRSLPVADIDELVGRRRRVQMQLGGVRSGMARSAAVACRTAEEADAQRKRRREQKNLSDCKRRKEADNEDGKSAMSESEAGESEGDSGEGEGDAELADLDDGTDLVERRRDERRQQAWLDAGCPGWHRSPPLSCPHGVLVTDDWIIDEGFPATNFSSRCGSCLVHQVAVCACEAVVAAAAPDDPPDPDDPWGGVSADCFYDNGSGDPANRRLAGGLSFALPHELYGPAKHGGPPEREPERKRKAPMGVDEREPDWAPWASGEHGVASKSADYYYKYDARAEAGFMLMQHNAFANPLEVYRWLDEPPPGQPPLPPPPNLPPPPADDEPEPVGDPPKRSEHAKGKRGRKTFHSKRAEWYKRATGGELSGSLEKQNHDFDRVARRYRAYSDYRAHERYTRERREQNEREQRERRCGEHADFD